MALESEDNLLTFANFTKKHKLAFHVWFVNFWDTNDKVLQEYCYHPNTKFFSLNFDTRMLVKCGDDSNLREWYSVNSKEQVLTNDLMTWSPETGLVLKSKKNLYQRRYNVDGSVLRVSSVKV